MNVNKTERTLMTAIFVPKIMMPCYLIVEAVALQGVMFLSVG